MCGYLLGTLTDVLKKQNCYRETEGNTTLSVAQPKFGKLHVRSKYMSTVDAAESIAGAYM
jgi:hypothetical protein